MTIHFKQTDSILKAKSNVLGEITVTVGLIVKPN